jgi:hypothetical protein
MIREMNLFNDVTRTITQQKSIPLAGTEEVINKSVITFTDSINYTPKGVRSVVETISEVIETTELVEDGWGGVSR